LVYKTIQVKPNSLAVTDDVLLKIGKVYALLNWQCPSSECSNVTGTCGYKKNSESQREMELFSNSEVLVFPPILQRLQKKFDSLGKKGFHPFFLGWDGKIPARH